MQTTLRIDDNLYRDAKTKAAREGLTLTKFLEEGLRMRLEKHPGGSSKPHRFRVHRSDEARGMAWQEVLRVADEEQLDHDLGKLGLRGKQS
jgi:hypothetical protein